jgi:hypothetical protein
VQESGSFQTTQKVPKKSDFWEKSDFSNRAQTCPKNDKEIRSPRNPIFLEKSDFSNRVPKRAQKIEIRSPRNPIFLEKSDFSNRAQTCLKNDKEIRSPRNPIFGKNRIFQTVPKRA